MNQEELEKAQDYLRNNVTGILEKMTVDLLINKPDNVVNYMMTWLDEKGNDVQKEFQRKIKDRPEGVETSESSEEDDDDNDEEVFSLPEKKMTIRQKRKSVSAEVYGIHNPKGDFKPIVIPKEEEEKLKIKELIKNIFMFKHLEEKEMAIIIDSMQIKKFEKDEMVIQQGDDGNELYVVYSGQLKCNKRFPGKDEDTFLKNYESGEVFGELSLLYNAPRAASILAIEKSVLYSLDRECFNHIVKESAIKNRNKYEDFLSKVEVLQSLDNYERSKLCDCLEILNYENGEKVFSEGQKGNTFYLIIEGKAVAFKKNPLSGEDEEVYKYRETMYFGELALLGDQPRAASIIAVDQLKVARIDRNSFKRILGPLEEILKRNAEKYRKFVRN